MTKELTAAFDARIGELAKLGRPRIAFGLRETNEAILNSLRAAREYADIVLVGNRSIKDIADFETIVSDNPEEKIAALLVDGEVEGVVRGTIDDFKSYEAYQSLVGKEKTKDMIELGLLEDAHGRRFFLSQGSNPLGWTREEKIKDCEGIVKFLESELGIAPRIGCITGVRHETYLRKKDIKDGVQLLLNQTYEDAEFLVEHFSSRGVAIKNYAIELDAAVADRCNIIVPPNGMTGNQIFRSVVFLGGGRLLAGSRANLPHPWEDNSRSETDYTAHVRWLAAWINGRTHQKFKGGQL